ncbi:uncharacterized protein TRIADDRAFT_51564 [Trichoplax adhaerens]|uniref:Protein kinase domain-containing protein n=1 Tax=Trichoplax adhaerens TaxID=10228 RepID=B3RJS0_TRIAD|nr:hypothetical protein TRIADDRAFT_51564 [Trichoplax adhaerens]EDV29342.1 hypothetical protein TRIADDRAFT_51564 [Trichoplax adhaerens]|eukprot:XP_002108544.1 hypothetical protein TRIADDRAFT_51564 [Trichoplax adhaerens]
MEPRSTGNIQYEDQDEPCHGGCCPWLNCFSRLFRASVIYADVPKANDYSPIGDNDDQAPPSDSAIQSAIKKALALPGFFSTTYRITIDGKVSAFKKWKPEMSSYLSDKDQLIEQLLRLNHESLRITYSYHVHLGGLLQEYLPYSLRQLMTLKGDKLPQCKERLSILKDVINGLCYLRDSNVVHNCLTSTNVLIDNNGSAKISDGCLDFTGSVHAQSTLPSHVGKIGYCCNEALCGKVIPANDIYSFGARDYLMHASHKNWKKLKDKRISWKVAITKIDIYRPRKKLLNLAAWCLAETTQERPPNFEEYIILIEPFIKYLNLIILLE